jgi:TrmH family RNA methyltransferase
MAQPLLDNIRIVLVATTHPGNIGASARAMKTMGLGTLVLVEPKQFPSAEATALASGADDLLARARVVPDLAAAVEGCGSVLATSARERSLSWPVLDPASGAARLLAEAAAGPVALVFGREHAGLTNEELGRCNAMVKIPTRPDYRSLNLAAAVQVMAYEIQRQFLGAAQAGRGLLREDAPPATAGQMEELYAHLRRTMTAVGFYDPERPRRLMRRLRRLFNRAGLDHNEVQILRGFLAAVDERIKPRR